MCKILKSIYISLMLIVSPQIKAASDTCHPKINPRLPQYIAGYGSLIDEQSKKTTDSKAYENIPVLIKGFKRSWCAHGNLPGFNATFLSLNENKKGAFNGVIYRVSDPKEIELYDIRETVYCRKELSAEQIKIYTKIFLKKYKYGFTILNQHRMINLAMSFPLHNHMSIFLLEVALKLKKNLI